MVKVVDWNSKGSQWAWLETKYGLLLSYEGAEHNEQYEQLSYQPNIVQLLESSKYDTFVDVGAEIGLFSLVASCFCKRVISYEASPFLFGILLYNMREKQNVECVYGFVGKEGQIPKMQDQLGAIVSVKMKEYKQELTEYNVPVLELDNEVLYLARSGKKMLIKLDVEGNELEVLNASNKLITLENVDWIVDVHFNRDPNEIATKYFKNRKITIKENVIEIS